MALIGISEYRSVAIAYQTQNLNEISKVDLYGAGLKNMHENSIYYKVLIKFRNGTEHKILETKGHLEAFKKASEIRAFLNIYENIDFSNHRRIEM